MIKNQDTLQYIVDKLGKTVLVIHNDKDSEEYYYLIEEFRPANPTIHVYDNFVKGRYINGVLVAINGFANGLSVGDVTLQQKILEQPIHNFSFSNFKWIWFKGHDQV